MDSRRFDRLAKLVSDASGSRREAFKVAIGGGLAAVIGINAEDEADAANRQRRRERRRRRRQRRRNACDGTNQACGTGSPGSCCSQICCGTAPAFTTGICASAGGVCCTVGQRGGYCAAATPQCCGTNRCCAAPGATTPGSICCTTSTGQGYCCSPGQMCGGDVCLGTPTVARVQSESTSNDGAGGAPRIGGAE